MSWFRCLGGFAALTVLAALPARTAAAAEPSDSTSTIAVLGLEALDGAPDGIASDITDALRQRVASTKGQQLVQGKDLVEVKLVFSCPDEAPPCMAQAGKSMGASKLIFGNVKRAGADYQVTLKLLDVAHAAVESWAAETIARKKAESQAFRSLAPEWLSKLTGKGAGGKLQIRASVVGASVSLDGTHVGVTGSGPIVVPDVAPGHHEVSVEKDGYTTTKQEFTLATGQSLPLNLSLSVLSADVGGTPPNETAPLLIRRPEPAGETSSSSGGSHTLSRAAFWVAVVGTLTTAGLGIKFAKDVQQINDELNPLRNRTLSDPEHARQTSLLDQGHAAERKEIVFLSAAGVLAIAGGYFLYRGYLDPGSETTTTARGLRIFPTAAASAGGIVTELDF